VTDDHPHLAQVVVLLAGFAIGGRVGSLFGSWPPLLVTLAGIIVLVAYDVIVLRNSGWIQLDEGERA